MSIDPAAMELAAAIHGGSDKAAHWIIDRAEDLWEEDRLNRLAAKLADTIYRPDASISRIVQREIVEAATARLLSGAGAAPGAAAAAQKPRKRRSSARSSADGSHMAGSLVEVNLRPNGAMYGTVLTGDHAGRELSDLKLSTLLDLLVEARELSDLTDATLLEAYLDREHPDWRAYEDPESSLLREDREILGLPEGADADQVKMAHRRLMAKVHPDVGGTEALATRINLARDRLLLALNPSPAADAAAAE